MAVLRLVTVSGQRGAGKETMLNAILGVFDKMHRIVPHTTRAPRPSEQNGREYHFVDEAEFDRLLMAGEFIFNGRIGERQRSGTLRREFMVSDHGSIIDIMPSGARTLCREVVSMGGVGLKIAVFASIQKRRNRIRLRQPGISDDHVEQLLRDDPVPSDCESYADFDALIDNEADDPSAACHQAVQLVRERLYCLV